MRDGERPIAKQLRDYRRAAGLTQEQLAAAAESSAGAISDYERGVHEPNIWSLARIARALDVTIDDIIYRTPAEASEARAGARNERDALRERLMRHAICTMLERSVAAGGDAALVSEALALLRLLD